MQEKNILRKLHKEKRRLYVDNLSQEEVAEFREQFLLNIKSCLLGKYKIALYKDENGEAFTSSIADYCIRNGLEVCYPIVDGSDMYFEFLPDFITVPLVAFSSDGVRLGQGGGYYDKFLAKFPNIDAVGLSWSFQEESKIPVEDHDVNLKAIVTEKKLIKV